MARTVAMNCRLTKTGTQLGKTFYLLSVSDMNLTDYWFHGEKEDLSWWFPMMTDSMMN